MKNNQDSLTEVENLKVQIVKGKISITVALILKQGIAPSVKSFHTKKTNWRPNFMTNSKTTILHIYNMKVKTRKTSLKEMCK